MIELEQLQNNTKARVLINFPETQQAVPRNQPLVGFLTASPALGGGADWAAPSTGESTVNDLIQAGVDVANFSGADVDNFVLKSVMGSSLSWRGTQNYEFSLSMVFIALKGTDDVLIPARRLSEAVFPEFDESNIKIVTRLKAPLGYRKISKDRNTPSGTVSIQIGEWFKTKPIFVVRSYMDAPSLNVISSGKPLYTQLTVSFISARIMSSREIREMFLS